MGDKNDAKLNPTLQVRKQAILDLHGVSKGGDVFNQFFEHLNRPKSSFKEMSQRWDKKRASNDL